MYRFKGLQQLVHDAVAATTDLVEEHSEAVAAKAMGVIEQVPGLGPPARVVDALRRTSARGVYGSIHGVNRIVAQLGDRGLDALAIDASEGAIVPMRSDCTGRSPWLEDAAIGALNGVVGDHLHDRGNALDLGMHLRTGDAYVAPGDIEAPRIALFLHGVCVTEWCWCMNAEATHGDASVNFGTLLQRDLGYTPVFLRYNTGRHISHNGRQLAELLGGLRAQELVLIGHSMGGLVARSACHYAVVGQQPWAEALRHVVCLGSPNQGAPLEKAGNVITSVLEWFDVPGAVIPAQVLNVRSAGIKDLRFGYLLDEDWSGHAPDALLDNRRQTPRKIDGVPVTYVAARLTEQPDHPVAELLGDLMVRTESANGPAEEQGPFPVASIPGVLHHEIPSHPAVYARVLAALS